MRLDQKVWAIVLAVLFGMMSLYVTWDFPVIDRIGIGLAIGNITLGCTFLYNKLRNDAKAKREAACQKIFLATDQFPLIDSGRKTQSVSKGRHDRSLGPATITDGVAEARYIGITSVRYTYYCLLTEADALASGCNNLIELRAKLARLNIFSYEEVTVTTFNVTFSSS